MLTGYSLANYLGLRGPSERILYDFPNSDVQTLSFPIWQQVG